MSSAAALARVAVREGRVRVSRSERRLLSKYRRRLGNRFPVVPRLGPCEVDAAAGAHDCLTVSEHTTAWRYDVDVVTELHQLASSARGHQRLDIDVTAAERPLCEASGLERFLHIEPEINDVGYELRVGLRLIEPTHDAEADLNVALRNKRRSACRQRTP